MLFVYATRAQRAPLADFASSDGKAIGKLRKSIAGPYMNKSAYVFRCGLSIATIPEYASQWGYGCDV